MTSGKKSRVPLGMLGFCAIFEIFCKNTKNVKRKRTPYRKIRNPFPLGNKQALGNLVLFEDLDFAYDGQCFHFAFHGMDDADDAKGRDAAQGQSVQSVK